MKTSTMHMLTHEELKILFSLSSAESTWNLTVAIGRLRTHTSIYPVQASYCSSFSESGQPAEAILGVVESTQVGVTSWLLSVFCTSQTSLPFQPT